MRQGTALDYHLRHIKSAIGRILRLSLSFVQRQGETGTFPCHGQTSHSVTITIRSVAITIRI